ncbi:ABC transporter ATP-binding protein [Flaviflexus salsibiostraticola]|uniref:ABC-type quaternary amine transporter n=1 Tax=Flaviflexus salsibiostraticola TaxID=1282737 RepID=A0A3Q8WVQ3_9ACTO|nr:ABC transporter ATP-binding protein [Flaviflexus salsibiostraticola]AZN30195.1 ABC transporter ATP-binding protein [Flaviflexus salsibiostraticola]
MIELENLTVSYGDLRAVDGVSLTVDTGDILALLGPSGCGKSSLLRGVVGLEPSTGEILIDGSSVAGVPVHRRRIGMVFQDAQLFTHRTVAGNIAYGLKGQDRGTIARRVEEVLELVGLAGMGERSVTTLSGGQAQRVALARSLAPRPDLLLLDEPLSALDRVLRERLSQDLRTILKGAGATAIYVTHDHDEAFAVADRVGIMDEGRLLQIGTPEQLLHSPAVPEVTDFLGSAAIVKGRVIEPTEAGTRVALPAEIEIPGTVTGDGVRLRITPLGSTGAGPADR